VYREVSSNNAILIICI